jgi:hypothetical protein
MSEVGSRDDAGLNSIKRRVLCEIDSQAIDLKRFQRGQTLRSALPRQSGGERENLPMGCWCNMTCGKRREKTGFSSGPRTVWYQFQLDVVYEQGYIFRGIPHSMYPIFHICVTVFVTSEIWLEFQCAGCQRLVRGGCIACVCVLLIATYDWISTYFQAI